MSQLEITSVEPYVVANPWKPWTFVVVETNEGIRGYGEATLPRNAFAIEAAIREEEKYYLEEDPFDTEKLFLKMYRDRGGVMPHLVKMGVISSVDIACWDIKGKVLGEPIYKLLGGSVHGNWLPTYANGWYTGTNRDPDSFADAAERVIADGYRALKFDPFGSAWSRMNREEFNRSIEIVEAVREAVGPDVDIMIEAHYRFTAGAAIEIARALEPYAPTWFEQPTPPDSLTALRKVAQRSPIPIAVDRSTERGVDADLLATGVDIVQPDLLYTGGITRGKKMAAVAEAEHVSFAPHNANGPLSTAICAHVDAASPNFMIQEIFEDYAHPEWSDRLLDDPPTVENGRLRVPEGPGLGVELDLDAVREHEYTEDSDEVSVMNLFEQGWENRSFDRE